MAVTFRAASGGQSSTAATAASVTQPTASAAGDMVLVAINAKDSQTFQAVSGWTLSSQNANAATIPFTTAVYYKVLSGSESWPISFTWTGSSVKYAWNAIAFTPGGGNAMAIDGVAAVKVDTAGATTHTANSQAAGAASVCSVVLNCGRRTASSSTGITVTAPANWTEPTNGDQTTASGSTTALAQLGMESCYRTGQSGTVAPGAATWSQTTAANVYHFLLKDQASAVSIHPGVAAVAAAAARPGQESPALELSQFGTFTGVHASDTISSVTLTVSQFATAAGTSAPTYELWDYSGTPAIIGGTRTGTASTSSANIDQLTFTGVTYGQLATLRVRIHGFQGSAPSGTFQVVDWASLTVSFFPAGVNAGVATVSAVATPAPPAVKPAARVATATATAVAAQVVATHTAPAQVATVAAAATAVTANVKPNAVVATATAAVSAAAAAVQPGARVASVLTAVPAVTASTGARAGVATVGAAAVQPAITTSGTATANAQVAIVSAVATAAAASLSAGATPAAAAVTAPPATADVRPAARVATAGAAAAAPMVAATANATAATVAATAPPATAGVTVSATVAIAAAAAMAAAAAPSAQPAAGPAAVLAAAGPPSVSVTVNAGVAAVVAVAPQPGVTTTGSRNAPAGVAAVSATALDATASIAASAGVATVGATAGQAAVSTVPQVTVLAGVATVAAVALAPGVLGVLSPTGAIAGIGTAGARPAIGTGPASLLAAGQVAADASVAFIVHMPTAALTAAGTVQGATRAMAQAQLAAVGQLNALAPPSRLAASLAAQGGATADQSQHAPNIKASGTATVSNPRNGTASVTGTVSTSNVSDPREGVLAGVS